MTTGAELTTGPRRLHHAFEERRGRAALMPYLMAGFPSLEGSLEVGRAYAKHADLVEVGVPFSDPLADGPVIQAAGQAALKAGATFDDVLEKLTQPLGTDVPVVLMCYMNQILAYGVEAAPFAMLTHGVSGLIVPDLPAAEAAELRAACDEAEVALVPLVAPTTPPEEVRFIAENARGFVYVVSVTGVTGERAQLPPEIRRVVGHVQEAATVPAVVGFGIGTPAQAAAVAEIADGVIIGSRLVREIAEAASLEDGLAGIDRFLAETSNALRLPPG
jgi:tryptophan synthase alpha chain